MIVKSIYDRLFRDDKDYQTYLNHYENLQGEELDERYYHNISHVEYMLTKLYRLMPLLDGGVGIGYLQLQILFHDIYIDPKNSENEQESFKLFKDVWHPQLKESSKVDISKVERGILVTSKHTQDQTGLDPTDKTLLDLDLLSYSENRDRYVDICFNIRREYGYLSIAEWMEGRTEFLVKMLDRENMFYNESLEVLFAEHVRANIKNEISFYTT